MKPLTAETWVVPRVHDRYGQHKQSLHRAPISDDIRVREVIEERSIVDRVTREKHLRGVFVEANATGGMTGKVQHFESAIAEIDDVSFLEQPGRLEAAKPIVAGAVTTYRHRRQQSALDVVSRTRDGRSALGRPSIEIERNVVVR